MHCSVSSAICGWFDKQNFFYLLAERKRDPMYSTMKNAEESVSGTYLLEARQIFDEWRQTGIAGLTYETFAACIQTMGAVPELAEYLLDYHGFEYLLSGKLMSDPIEGRFGWYRQLNGGNFFMSVKQVLEAEKKIRCLSLLQEQILFTAAGISKQDDAPVDDQDDQAEENEHSWLIDLLATASIDDIPDSDAAVCYYVSGYIARSISRRRRCCCCKDLLIGGSDIQTALDIPEKHKELFEMANRGGLSEPTELSFAITAIAMQCYTTVASDVSALNKLFQCTNQRQAFVNAMRKMAQSKPAISKLLNVKCSRGHAAFNAIVCSIFNCCAKNELKRLNSKPMLQEPPAKTLRKVRKLTSKS